MALFSRQDNSNNWLLFAALVCVISSMNVEGDVASQCRSVRGVILARESGDLGTRQARDILTGADSGVCHATAVAGQLFRWKISTKEVKEFWKPEVVTNRLQTLAPWMIFDDERRLLIGLPVHDDVGLYCVSVRNMLRTPHSIPCDVIFVEVVDSSPRARDDSSTHYHKPISCQSLKTETKASILLDIEWTDMTAEEKVGIINDISNLFSTDENAIKVTLDRKSVFHDRDILIAGAGDVPVQQHTGITISWTVGCGLVQPRHLKILEHFETTSKSKGITKWIGYPVVGWFVFNVKPNLFAQRLRQKRLRRQIQSTLPLEQLQPSSTQQSWPLSSSVENKDTKLAFDPSLKLSLEHLSPSPSPSFFLEGHGDSSKRGISIATPYVSSIRLTMFQAARSQLLIMPSPVSGEMDVTTSRDEDAGDHSSTLDEANLFSVETLSESGASHADKVPSEIITGQLLSTITERRISPTPASHECSATSVSSAVEKASGTVSQTTGVKPAIDSKGPFDLSSSQMVYAVLPTSSSYFPVSLLPSRKSSEQTDESNTSSYVDSLRSQTVEDGYSIDFASTGDKVTNRRMSSISIETPVARFLLASTEQKSTIPPSTVTSPASFAASNLKQTIVIPTQQLPNVHSAVQLHTKDANPSLEMSKSSYDREALITSSILASPTFMPKEASTLSLDEPASYPRTHSSLPKTSHSWMTTSTLLQSHTWEESGSAVASTVQNISLTLFKSTLVDSIQPTRASMTSPENRPFVTSVMYLTEGEVFRHKVTQEASNGTKVKTVQLTNTSIGIVPKWVSLDPTTGELIGLPLPRYAGNYTFGMSLCDDGFQSCRTELKLIVRQQATTGATHEFILKLGNAYEEFVNDVVDQVFVVEAIARACGDSDARNITVVAVANGSSVIVWTNTTLYSPSSCPIDGIAEVKNRLFTGNTNFTNSLLRELGPSFLFRNLSLRLRGVCDGVMLEGYTRDVIFISDDSLLSIIVVSAILVCLVVSASLTLFLTWRRRFEKNADKNSMYNNDTSVIFAYEVGDIGDALDAGEIVPLTEMFPEEDSSKVPPGDNGQELCELVSEDSTMPSHWKPSTASTLCFSSFKPDSDTALLGHLQRNESTDDSTSSCGSSEV